MHRLLILLGIINVFECLECSKSCQKHFNKDSIKRFANTHDFCDGHVCKFCLMLNFIHMKTWIPEKDLMKYCCLIKKIFTLLFADVVENFRN